jgi:hypothetical protein
MARVISIQPVPAAIQRTATATVAAIPPERDRNTNARLEGFQPGELIAISVGLWLLHLLHDLIGAKAGWPLPWWVFLECADELANYSLRGYHQERMAQQPIVVGVRRDLGALIRVHPQIEHGRGPHADERITPDRERSFHSLFAEHELPIIVSKANELSVIIEVEKFLTRGLILLASLHSAR